MKGEAEETRSVEGRAEKGEAEETERVEGGAGKAKLMKPKGWKVELEMARLKKLEGLEKQKPKKKSA